MTQFSKEDNVTLKVADESGEKLWTLDTINASIQHIESEEKRLAEQKEPYLELLKQAKKLKLVEPGKVKK